MEDSVFTKIIKGELPSNKVYEDEFAIAILTIEPDAPGHLLVIPKKQTDKFYEMSDEDFSRLMVLVKKIAIGLEKASGLRTIMQVIGTDVPHVHIHLVPLRDGDNKLSSKSPEEIVEEIKKEIV